MSIKYVVTKDLTPTAIKTDAKSNLTEKLLTFLATEYGAENVAIVRVGTASGAKNVIGIRAGTVEEDGGVFDLCFTLDPSTKEWQERLSSKTGKVWREGFDFETARDEYVKYCDDKAQKAAAKAAAKEKKIAADTAARAKKKETE